MVLDHRPVDLESPGSPALLDALAILRDLQTTGRRPLPDALPAMGRPQCRRTLVGPNGITTRHAYA